MLPSMRRQAAKTRTKLTLGLMALLSCLLAATIPLPLLANSRGKVRGLGALAQGHAALPATAARVERSKTRERPFSRELVPDFAALNPAYALRAWRAIRVGAGR